MEGKVTEIQIQKNNSERANVFVDGEFAFPCSVEIIYKFSIQKGEVIKAGNIKTIAEEDSFMKGKSAALRFIERTYKTEQQLVQKLLDKGYEETIINRIIIFMKEYNFIDDVRYTEAFVKEKLVSSGRKKIQFELERKGVHKSLIEEKLNLLLEGREEQIAEELCNKKLKVLLKSEKDKNKIYKKLSDYLSRNGYDYGLISSVVRASLKDIVMEVMEPESEEEDNATLLELAKKRYNIIIKSEGNQLKINKKLADFLLRKGYKWDDIKQVLKSLEIRGGED